MPELGLVEGPSGRKLRIALISESITGGLLDAQTSVALESVADSGHGWGIDPAAWVQAQRQTDMRRTG